MFYSTKESMRLLPSCDNTARLRRRACRTENIAQPNTIHTPRSSRSQAQRLRIASDPGVRGMHFMTFFRPAKCNTSLEPSILRTIEPQIPWEVAMDRVTRCLHCGKRMVPASSLTGRTELVCVFCNKIDPMEMTETRRWAESPLAHPASETVLDRG